MHPQDRAFAAQSVHAIIVTAGRGDLEAVVEAVARQTHQPDYVTVVTVGGPPADLARTLSTLFDDRAWVVGPVGARNFGDAIRLAQTSPSMPHDPVWYWFLHDDSIPDAAALQELLTVASRGGTIALVGPKQVVRGDRDHILELGIDATRSGRRVDLSATVEIDQGQYDGRDDVLAVGTAGMLIMAEVWRRTRGLDPHLGPFGDGLEYGRRLRRSGYRVVVAPLAIIEHQQLSLRRGPQKDLSFRARREAQLYNWLLAVPVLLVPLLLLLLIPWSLLRGAARLIVRRPRLAAAEVLAYLDLIGAIPALSRGRRRLRRSSTIPTRALSGLEMSAADLESFRRDQRRIRRSRQREDERIDPLSTAAWRRHLRSGRIALAVMLGLFAVVSFILWSPYLAGMVGAAWAELPASGRALWDQTWSTWVFSGVGSSGPANPLLPLLAVIGLPLSWLGIAPTQVAQALLVAAAPLAAAGGWGVARLFTRSVPIRLSAGVLWGANPILLFVLAQGDLAQTLVWVASPVVVIGLWRATRPLPITRLSGVEEVAVVSRADALTGGGAAAVGLLLVASGAPGLALVAAVIGYLAALLPAAADLPEPTDDSPLKTPSGHAVALQPLLASRGRRLLAVTLMWLPAAVLTAPVWVWVASQVGRLGPQAVAVLLDPSGSGVSFSSLSAMPHGAFAAIALIPLWAVFALVASGLDPGRRPGVCRVASLVGVVVLPAAIVTPIAPLTVTLVAWLTAAVAGTREFRISVDENSGKQLFLPVGWAVIACAAGVFATVAALAFGPFGNPSAEGSVVATQGMGAPLVAREAASGDRAGRLLRLQTDGKTVRAELWRGGTRQQQDLSIGPRLGDDASADSARQSLADAVGALGVRSSDRSAGSLATFDIELVLLPPTESEGVGSLFANLDASSGFERIGTTDLGTLWRVRPDGNHPAWASLEDGTPVPAAAAGVSTELSATGSHTVYLAEVANPAWHATLNGEPLQTVADSEAGWRQAFELPEGGGHLTIYYSPAWRLWWLAALGILTLVAALVALPFRSRRPVWVVVPGSADDTAEETNGDLAFEVDDES